jgi:peptidoglycan/LPS O-acetylase OafA/YrhL
VLCAGWIAYRQYRLKQNLGLPARSLYFDIAAVLGLIGMVVLLWNLRHAGEFSLSIGKQPYAFPYFALLVALVLGTVPFATRIHRLIDNPLARYTARISFGLYIWHFPILELLRLFHNSNYRYFGIGDLGQWFGISLLALLAAYAVATLSYTHIEKPFLPKGEGRALKAEGQKLKAQGLMPEA